MKHERSAQRRPVVERRPPAAAALARKVDSAPSPARALQQRLGNQATQALVAPSSEPAGAVIQRMSAVSSPNDPAEIEAHATAIKVMRMSAPEAAPVRMAGAERVSRAPATAAGTPPAAVQVNTSGDSPLPAGLRSYMEPRFGADFGNVKIHTGEAAATQSAQINAKAFALGQHVFFGRNQFQPDTSAGKELIAHELTHTIQQGAAPQRDVAQRSALPPVAERVAPHLQRAFLGIPNPREYFAGKAAAIPGFTMFTVVIGFNPITNARVERNARNILDGAIRMIPGGNFISEALEKHGVLDAVANWVSTQFASLKDIASNVWQDIENFLAKFEIGDLADPGGLWDRARAIVERPITRIINFAVGLKDGIVTLIKEAILTPLAAFAQSTPGYALLCMVMGKDPITGTAVAQDPEALLGGFLKFIGEEEIWANMQKAKALPRVFAWFRGALGALRGFVDEIPGLFMQALRALDVIDIILIPRAFFKVGKVFSGFAVRIVSWGAGALWNLLEIIFDVVSPGALGYIKKTGGALQSILKNPLPFVGNLIKAAKLGFVNFGGNFLEHLKGGLINWLTGALPGVYIPKAFALPEIAKFTFSVLGLSWANIRQKLVKATSETAVKVMETGLDIVVSLVRDGPAAAWEKIKEQLSDLKDKVIGGITDMVVDMVVKVALPKMVAMFIPGAGFISAIISIYDTVMVFVNKISQIIEVVTGFIDSIVAIAAGQLGAAATRVEKTLSGVLSLAINFLAGFAGVGKVADKVMAIINKIRAPIDKAIDFLIGWIVKAAKKLFAKLTGKKEKPDERTPAQKQADLDKAMNAADHLLQDDKMTPKMVEKKLGAIKTKYRLTRLELVTDSKTEAAEFDHIEGEINPKKKGPKVKKSGKNYLGATSISKTQFSGSFSDPKWTWTGYPASGVTQHPANLKYHSPNTGTTVAKPTGNYKVAGASTTGQKNTVAWRAMIRDRVDAVKDDLKVKNPGLKPDTYERNGKLAVEAQFGGLGYKDLYLIGWEAHHIHPVNWGGTNANANFQYLLSSQHSSFTTWFNARKAEVLTELNKP
jgi:hypothetical protein